MSTEQELHYLSIHPGLKVVYCWPEAGYPEDNRRAQALLELGHEYTVRDSVVFPFHTEVWLEEVPTVSGFNHLMFRRA